MKYQHIGGHATGHFVSASERGQVPVWNFAAGAALVGLLLIGLGGCANPTSPTQTASSCSARQKPVENIVGKGFSAVGQWVIGRIPSSPFTPVVRTMGVPAAMGEVGRWLSPEIACSLNNPNDQKKAVDAVQVATITGQVQSWHGSEPGVSGTAKVVQSGGMCRTVQQTVTLSDGTQRTDDVKSCKGSSGWEVVQS